MKNLIFKIRFFFYCIKVILKGGEKDMAMCYVTCIVKELRKYSDVPNWLKPQVKELLIGMELEILVTE